MDPKKLDLAPLPIEDRGVLTVRESTGAPVLVRVMTRPSSGSPTRTKVLFALPVDGDVVGSFSEFRLEMN